MEHDVNIMPLKINPSATVPLSDAFLQSVTTTRLIGRLGK
jgi:hypothetical protein